MPFDGSGVFTRLYEWITDRNNGVKIRADRMDGEFDNYADALNLCMLRNGDSVATDHWDFGGKRIGNLGAPVSANDAVRKAYVDDAVSPGVSNIGDYLTTERAPGSNWLKRDGAIYSQASYPALAALLGTKYAKLLQFNLGSSAAGTIRASCWTGTQFVRVGDSGRIETSPTGASWTSRTSGTSEHLRGVAFGNGVVIAVGDNGTILTANDNAIGTWTSRTSGTTNSLRAIAYNSGKFVVCGVTQTVRVSTDNGVNWSSKTISGLTASLYGVTYGNGRWCIVGDLGSAPTGVAATSVDADTWGWAATGAAGGHAAVAFGKGVFVASGDFVAYVSTSGQGSWTAVPTPSNILGLTFGLNQFIGGGNNGTTSSIDGRTWDTHTAISGSFFSIAANSTQAIAVGSSGVFATSQYAIDTVTQFQVPADSPDIGYIKAL